MTDQLQKDARRPENKDDQLKKLMAQVAVKYLDAREWADKTYRHYAVSQSIPSPHVSFARVCPAATALRRESGAGGAEGGDWR
jgi:hypothetical protein